MPLSREQGSYRYILGIPLVADILVGQAGSTAVRIRMARWPGQSQCCISRSGAKGGVDGANAKHNHKGTDLKSQRGVDHAAWGAGTAPLALRQRAGPRGSGARHAGLLDNAVWRVGSLGNVRLLGYAQLLRNAREFAGLRTVGSERFVTHKKPVGRKGG